MRGEIDINDASRPIKSKEVDACAEIGIDFVELSAAYDGLAVLVNPENDWVDYFTVEELENLESGRSGKSNVLESSTRRLAK